MVAALDPGLEVRSGAYLSDCQVVEEEGQYYAEWAKDKNGQQGEELWHFSERLTQEKFQY
jgi:hypothetical protein